MKNIVVILKNPNIHLISIYEQMQSVDYRVTYFCWEDLPEHRKNNNWKIPETLSVGVESPENIQSIKKADILVFHGFIAPFPKNILLFRKMLKKRKQIFMSSEGFERAHSKGIKKVIFKWLVNSKKVTYLGIGNGADQDYRNMGMSKWTMRRFGFAEKYADEVKPYRTDADSVTRVIAVGRLVDIKNYESLLQAVKFSAKNRHFELIFAGEGESREKLEKMVSNLQIEDKVKFVGQLDQNGLHELYESADFLVLPSHYDGWGVVINQSLHYGLPVIVSKNVRSGRNYLVDHNKNGFIFSNQEELNTQFVGLLDNAELRKRFSEHAKKKYQLWNIGNIAKRLAEVFENPNLDFEEGPLKVIK